MERDKGLQKNLRKITTTSITQTSEVTALEQDEISEKPARQDSAVKNLGAC